MPQPPVTTYVLAFEQPEYAEYEVRIRAASIQELFDAERLRDADADRDRLLAVWQAFLTRVLSWNITDAAGTPLPVTLETLKTMEPAFVGAMVTASVKAGASVARPLPESSPGGATFPAGTIPMEISSPSLAS